MTAVHDQHPLRGARRGTGSQPVPERQTLTLNGRQMQAIYEQAGNRGTYTIWRDRRDRLMITTSRRTIHIGPSGQTDYPMPSPIRDPEVAEITAHGAQNVEMRNCMDVHERALLRQAHYGLDLHVIGDPDWRWIPIGRDGKIHGQT